MNNPFVSICIPTYNGEAYLHDCIRSCLAQKYDNFEVVICDDGSTDNTREIIESYRLKDGRIRYHKNEKNLGLVGNWNRCLDLASGEWIKFVFQDDYIAPECLDVFSSHIEPHIVLMVSERNFILEDEANEDQRNYYSNVVRTLTNTISPQKDDLFGPALISKLAARNIGMNFIGEPSLSFFRKGIIEKTGSFNPLLKQICDLEFFLRVASQWGLKYIPGKLCAFRIHGQSTTSTNVSSRYFQLHYIEPLLLAWLMLYDPGFSALRKNLNAFEKYKLGLWFRLKCYQAGKVNKEQAQGHPVFDDRAAAFGEIRKRQKGSPLVKLIAAFRK